MIYLRFEEVMIYLRWVVWIRIGGEEKCFLEEIICVRCYIGGSEALDWLEVGGRGSEVLD